MRRARWGMPDHTEEALGQWGSSPRTSGWQLREGGGQPSAGFQGQLGASVLPSSQWGGEQED